MCVVGKTPQRSEPDKTDLMTAHNVKNVNGCKDSTILLRQRSGLWSHNNLTWRRSMNTFMENLLGITELNALPSDIAEQKDKEFFVEFCNNALDLPVTAVPGMIETFPLTLTEAGVMNTVQLCSDVIANSRKYHWSDNIVVEGLQAVLAYSALVKRGMSINCILSTHTSSAWIDSQLDDILTTCLDHYQLFTAVNVTVYDKPYNVMFDEFPKTETSEQLKARNEAAHGTLFRAEAGVNPIEFQKFFGYDRRFWLPFMLREINEYRNGVVGKLREMFGCPAEGVDSLDSLPPEVIAKMNSINANDYGTTMLVASPVFIGRSKEAVYVINPITTEFRVVRMDALISFTRSQLILNDEMSKTPEN